jgi:hypothetical protein
MCASILPLGYCVVAEARGIHIPMIFHDINIFFIKKTTMEFQRKNSLRGLAFTLASGDTCK